MTKHLMIDLISHDPHSDEYVLYLVEDGPWPHDRDEDDWNQILAQIQNRVFDAIDAAVDGKLEERFPESVGKAIRVQVDSPHGLPTRLAELIDRLNEYVQQDNNDYGQSIQSCGTITGVRVVTGHSLGRFPE